MAMRATPSEIVTEAIAGFLEAGDWHAASDVITRGAVEGTGSEFGFLGVLVGDGALRILSHRGVQWHTHPPDVVFDRAGGASVKQADLDFTNFDLLFGEALMSGETIVSNEVASDLRFSGQPAGHPPLSTFLGVPMRVGAQVIGVIALANRLGGYAESECREAETLAATAAVLYSSYQRTQEFSATQSRSRTIFEASPNPMVVSDAAGYATDANEAFLKLVGYQREEIIGRPYDLWVHPDDIESIALRRAATQAGESLSPTPMSRRLIRKDGSVVEVVSSIALLTEERSSILVMYRDVTAQRAAERELIASEELYRTMVENSMNSIMLMDPDGRIVMCNEATTALLGYAREELIGRLRLDFIHPDDHEAVIAARAVAGPEQRYAIRRFVRKDGSLIETETAISPLRRNGERIGSVISHKDISAQLVAEAALRQSEAQLARAQLLAQVGSWEFEVLADRWRCSDEFYRLMGLPPQGAALSSAALRALIPNLDALVGLDSNEHAALAVRSTTVTLPGGGVRMIEARTEIDYDVAGTPFHAEGTLQDITDREQWLRDARRATVHAEFLATMSHELRTPLNSILGFGQLLAERTSEPLTDTQRRDVTDIIDSGTQLLELITDILDVSKMEAEAYELHVAPFDLAQAITATVGAFRAIASQRDIELRTELEALAPAFVADERAFRRVLLNLVSNAVKFTDAGSVTVRARMQGGGLLLEVADTGIGIAPEQLEQIFEPFMQVDGGLNRQHGGTGLGLAIVRLLVELHGGVMEVHSVPGQGSTFAISLPDGGSADTG